MLSILPGGASGGEAAKLRACRAQRTRGIILIMSLGSSTTFVEFGLELYDAAWGKPGSIIFASHDREEVERAAENTRRWAGLPVLIKQRLVTEWVEAESA